jgi:hypothetical protein
LKCLISIGSNVKEEVKAINIARLVKRPKVILGIKLDNERIENPKIMVIAV